MSKGPTRRALGLLVGCTLSCGAAAWAQTMEAPLPGPRTAVVKPTDQTIDEILDELSELGARLRAVLLERALSSLRDGR